ncbi:MAG: hypothetical protein U9N86_08750 [Bacteroidota bacterium]|nr:hypothetical protein [Bacteroidota bacterium]
MLSTFNNITKTILKILLFFWVLSISTLAYWIGISLLNQAMQVIPVVIFSALISMGIGVYFYVLITIPQQLASAFDVIKNKVALNQYTGVEEFQKEVAKLIIHFFRFPGLEITGGIFEFLKCTPLTINTPEDLKLDHISKLTEVSWVAKNHKYKVLFVPISLGERQLGHMLLVTKGWTLKLFPKIIEDLENNFLDDQLFHMIAYETPL